MGGSIGNASGSTDTTIENCLTSDLLTRHYEKKYQLPRGAIVTWDVGDDVEMAVPKRLRSRLPDDLNQSVVDAWGDLGFRAKPEKQLAGQTALFLKRYFSVDPTVGQATMVGANIIKKMTWDRQMKYEALYGTYSLTEDEADLSVTLSRLFHSNDRFKEHVEKYEGRRVLPSHDSTWPYFVTDRRVLKYMRDWRGPLGPLLESDVEYFNFILESNSHLHPDRLRAITALQQLTQLRWHPHYGEIVKWVADHLNPKTVLVDLGLLAEIGDGSSYKVSDNEFSLVTPALMTRTAVSLWANYYRESTLNSVISPRKLLYYQFIAISSGEVPASEYGDGINSVLSELGYEAPVRPDLTREYIESHVKEVDFSSTRSLYTALVS